MMTHERGGPAVIGAGAVVVLAADLLYSASNWSGSFPRAFLISLAGLGTVVLLFVALRVARPMRAGRGVDRWYQRGVNLVLVVVMSSWLSSRSTTASAVMALAGFSARLLD
jgi:hypothetical protein